MFLSYRFKIYALMAGDIALVLLAFIGAFALRFGVDGKGTALFPERVGTFVACISVLLASSYIFDLYNISKHQSRKQIFFKSFSATVAAFLLLTAIFFLYPQLFIGRGLLAIFLTLFLLMQFAWHVLFILGVHHSMLAENILILGANRVAKELGELICATSRFNFSLAGLIKCDADSESAQVPLEMIVGRAHDLREIVQQKNITRILVALDDRECMEALFKDLYCCKLTGVEINPCAAFYEELTGKVLLSSRKIDEELIYSSSFRHRAVISAVKRLLEVTLLLVILLLTLPFSPLIALLVKLDSSGPILYRQVRVGQWGKEFTLYKFRTMHDNAEFETGPVWAQEDDPRIGRIGRILRKWRIDELPQLFNVLKGEMSLIGPRPERPEFVYKLGADFPLYLTRHAVKPGITGWAQVKYTYAASVEDAYVKLAYDLYYIKHASPRLDLIIILETFKVLILGRGR
ncbi:MAG: glycosyl transferase [Deltaproteobacteria bacterium HGW-Deltaproteobacteria-23]|nr:MAG: glycosyl transferase [Deltaproteobacteria bacterium HGW-Deltaproteobacteria-23]